MIKYSFDKIYAGILMLLERFFAVIMAIILLFVSLTGILIISFGMALIVPVIILLEFIVQPVIYCFPLQ